MCVYANWYPLHVPTVTFCSYYELFKLSSTARPICTTHSPIQSSIYWWSSDLCLDTRKSTREDSDQPRHQLSLIRVLVSARRNVGPLSTHRAPIENSDQTARMRRLIWVFDVHIFQLVLFAHIMIFLKSSRLRQGLFALLAHPSMAVIHLLM